eukprot:5052412-Pyramimonas_sp.AAC.1
MFLCPRPWHALHCFPPPFPVPLSQRSSALHSHYHPPALAHPFPPPLLHPPFVLTPARPPPPPCPPPPPPPRADAPSKPDCARLWALARHAEKGCQLLQNVRA